MIPIFIETILTLFIFLGSTLSDNLYHEKYRPQLHYSVPKAWMNDPDGLLYYKGNYHLFYQHYPNDTKWGPIHWGHAISKDLVHWETLPIALYPRGREYIFSGSAIIDYNNVTGLQTQNENKTMIAIFTAHTFPEHNESQWMAYSNDDGLSFKYYKNNPIITIEKNFDFRDPKVIKYGDYFIVLIVVFDHIQIFKSRDLKSWALMSKWGWMEGTHQGVWETPDLFPTNVTINGTITEKWVLLISTANTTGVSTGPNTQYFIGSFDGHTFTNENSNDTVLWLDYGPDNYAGVTYERPNRQHIFMSWMSRWDYAEALRTMFKTWDGQNAIPRDMKLVTNTEGRVLMSSLPVPEIEKLRKKSWKLTNTILKPNSTENINKLTQIESKLLDIDLSVNISRVDPKDIFGIELSGGKDKLRVYYNGSYVIDRTNTIRNFSKWFHGEWKAPRLTSSHIIDLRLILDVSSIEMFADSGLSVMTSLFFSEENLTSNISVFFYSKNKNSELSIIHLNVHQLESIWK